MYEWDFTKSNELEPLVRGLDYFGVFYLIRRCCVCAGQPVQAEDRWGFFRGWRRKHDFGRLSGHVFSAEWNGTTWPEGILRF